MYANLISNKAGDDGIYAFDAFHMPLQTNVSIIATDYTSYLVVHTCQSYLAGAVNAMDGIIVFTRIAMTNQSSSYATILADITP